ncbi:MAG: hypothetical protein HC881_19320 [Leptolyngbyaceae cyanobacterium SL_7_1]|nr:hypothetical protein [Leptolyngbyaceae cyanobacterium SL_7_1]
MRNVLSSIAFVASMATLLGGIVSTAHAQERQGCFMLTNRGEWVDLSPLCPSAAPFAAAEPELGTGDIQATLRWTTTDDLDLAVTDPNGQVVYYGSRSIPSGGQLDVDANAACGGTTSSPIENVFWPPAQAPQGSYSVAVNLFSRCTSGSAAIPFELRLLVQGNIQTLSGSVGEANPVATFPFTLP